MCCPKPQESLEGIVYVAIGICVVHSSSTCMSWWLHSRLMACVLLNLEGTYLREHPRTAGLLVGDAVLRPHRENARGPDAPPRPGRRAPRTPGGPPLGRCAALWLIRAARPTVDRYTTWRGQTRSPPHRMSDRSSHSEAVLMPSMFRAWEEKSIDSDLCHRTSFEIRLVAAGLSKKDVIRMKLE